MARLVVRLGRARTFNRRIMNLRPVQSRVDRVARELEGPARARLAAHRKTGDHSVFAYRDRHTRVIGLEGAAPMSVQYGHHAPNGRWIQGLYILPTSKG